MMNMMTDFLIVKPHTIVDPPNPTEGIDMQMIMNPLVLLLLDIMRNVEKAGNQDQAILLENLAPPCRQF